MNDRNARIIILLLAVGFAVSPVLSNGFGGFYTESFPVQVDRWPAQPVGWAFSIWGLIYLGLILASVWALWRPETMPGWGALPGPMASACSSACSGSRLPSVPHRSPRR